MSFDKNKNTGFSKETAEVSDVHNDTKKPDYSIICDFIVPSDVGRVLIWG